MRTRVKATTTLVCCYSPLTLSNVLDNIYESTVLWQKVEVHNLSIVQFGIYGQQNVISTLPASRESAVNCAINVPDHMTVTELLQMGMLQLHNEGVLSTFLRRLIVDPFKDDEVPLKSEDGRKIVLS